MRNDQDKIKSDDRLLDTDQHRHGAFQVALRNQHHLVRQLL